jgi:hypothetical protein
MLGSLRRPSQRQNISNYFRNYTAAQHLVADQIGIQEALQKASIPPHADHEREKYEARHRGKKRLLVQSFKAPLKP